MKPIIIILTVICVIFASLGFSQSKLVVRNDRGGLLTDRVEEIAQINQQGIPVEIRGSICLSSCTMYLGVENVCVESDVIFGFHGPSSYGRPLTPLRFEKWSQIMASYYPHTELREWFLTRARYRIRGFYKVSGKQIIEMGTPQCKLYP